MEFTNQLPFNLQFFADKGEGGSEGSESGKGDEGKVDSTSDGKEKTDKNDDKGSDEHMIPKSRFDEVNENYKTMKAELDEMKSAQTKAEQERQEKEKADAEKRGEYEDLYNQTKTEKESLQSEKDSADKRVEALEGVINGLLESKMEGIDEEYHDLIPEGMTPEQKLNWVDNAEKKGVFGKKEVNEPLGRQTNPNDEQTIDTDKMNPIQKMMSGYGK